ncbi:MAG: hypothetical protein MZU95_16695 [Desulfomicrobium escambiense]|nr:hypothetical protein [Desulfomicrobium escambiense]
MTGVLATIASWGGCRSGPEPEQLFAEAEVLRLQYEKTASQRAIEKYREAQAAWARRRDTPRAARAAERVGTTYGRAGSVGRVSAGLRVGLGAGAEVA